MPPKKAVPSDYTEDTATETELESGDEDDYDPVPDLPPNRQYQETAMNGNMWSDLDASLTDEILDVVDIKNARQPYHPFPTLWRPVLKRRVYFGGQAAMIAPELLIAQGITHVVTLREEIPDGYNYAPFNHLHIPTGDTPGSDIIRYFPKIMPFMLEGCTRDANGEKNAVLVHDEKGGSRAATCIAGFFMLDRKLPVWRAKNYAQAVKPNARISKTFSDQLSVFDRIGRTLDMRGSVGYWKWRKQHVKKATKAAREKRHRNAVRGIGPRGAFSMSSASSTRSGFSRAGSVKGGSVRSGYSGFSKSSRSSTSFAPGSFWGDFMRGKRSKAPSSREKGYSPSVFSTDSFEFPPPRGGRSRGARTSEPSEPPEPPAEEPVAPKKSKKGKLPK